VRQVGGLLKSNWDGLTVLRVGSMCCCLRRRGTRLSWWPWFDSRSRRRWWRWVRFGLYVESVASSICVPGSGDVRVICEWGAATRQMSCPDSPER